jgi:hypothetical protein
MDSTDPRAPVIPGTTARQAPGLVRRLLLVAPVVLVALALIVPASSTAAKTRKVALGVSIEHRWDEAATFDHFASQVGNRPRLWSLWSTWGNSSRDFPAAEAAWVAARGSVPFIFWEPFESFDSCKYANHKFTARGDYDSYIRSWAQAAKRHGKPIVVRWAHEINGAFFPWGIKNTLCNDTVSDYKAAWKRIVKIFRQVGANNVKFAWTVARSDAGGSNPYKAYYPGNKWVHYVGFSNFNWGAAKDKWTPMIQTIGNVMKYFTAFTRKPVIIAENATNTDAPAGAPASATKPNWIRDGYVATYKKYPQIKAIIYLNVDLSDIGHPDWSLDTPGWSASAGRSASHQAYEWVADQTRFRGKVG